MGEATNVAARDEGSTQSKEWLLSARGVLRLLPWFASRVLDEYPEDRYELAPWLDDDIAVDAGLAGVTLLAAASRNPDATTVLPPTLHPPVRSRHVERDLAADTISADGLAMLDELLRFLPDRPFGDQYRDDFDANPAVWEVAMAYCLIRNAVLWTRRLAYDTAGWPRSIRALDNVCLDCSEQVDTADVHTHAETCPEARPRQVAPA